MYMPQISSASKLSFLKKKSLSIISLLLACLYIEYLEVNAAKQVYCSLGHIINVLFIFADNKNI